MRVSQSLISRTLAALNTPGWLQTKLTAGSTVILPGIAIFFSLIGPTNCQATPAGTVDATYSFGASDFFVDPSRPYVYATSGSSLEVINSTTLAVAQSIPLPADGYGMTMSPDESKLFIAGGSSGSIFVLDTTTWTLLPSLTVADSPTDVAMGLNNRLYVLGSGIYQIDATTGASTGPYVPADFTYSGALRISPDRTRLYYADFGLSPGSLYQFDVSTTNPVVLFVNGTDIGENGEQLALSDDGSMVAYICGYGDGGYQIPNFRTSDMSLLGVFPTGAYPNCLAYSPDGKYAYALHTPYPTAVDIYDTSSYADVGQFPVAGEAKVMTADQTGQHLFVAFGQVTVYDTGRSVSITTNQPPICNIGGPYTVECQGSNTVVQLDGSGSSDPNGKPLTFTWSADCPGDSFDNPTSATPKLTLDATAAETCTVTLVVSDGLLTASNQAVVTVVDTTPPIIDCPSNKVVALGSNWNFDTPAAYDTCCGTNVTLTVLGTVTNANSCCSMSITRTWQATDCSGNSSTCAQTVTVVNLTPPDLSQLSVSPATLWPPDHNLVPVTIQGPVTDLCDPAPVWNIVSVTSSDRAAGPPNDGPDFEIAGASTLLLRSERDDPHAGRTYQIVVQATDDCGNATNRTLVVTVPGTPSN
jgi:hypothetical protein